MPPELSVANPLRLTDIALPLNHAESALTDAILAKLNLPATDLKGVHVFQEGVDARRKTNIQLIYTLDIELTPRPNSACWRPVTPCATSPDTTYKYVARAPELLEQRPVVGALAPAGFSSPCC